MKYLIVLLVATIACLNAAPPPPGPVEETNVQELKATLQPVQKELRSLANNAEFAVRDLAGEVLKSANELTASAKELIHPDERALSQDETKNLAVKAQDLGKQLLTKAIADYQPIKSNQKALSERLQEKLSTRGGQISVKKSKKSKGI